jgi:hypothetical protein
MYDIYSEGYYMFNINYNLAAQYSINIQEILTTIIC